MDKNWSAQRSIALWKETKTVLPPMKQMRLISLKLKTLTTVPASGTHCTSREIRGSWKLTSSVFVCICFVRKTSSLFLLGFWSEGPFCCMCPDLYDHVIKGPRTRKTHWENQIPSSLLGDCISLPFPFTRLQCNTATCPDVPMWCAQHKSYKSNEHARLQG